MSGDFKINRCPSMRCYWHDHHTHLVVIATTYFDYTAFPSSPSRWGRLRATMMPWPGLLEPFTECLLLGLLTSVATSHLFGVGVVRFMVFHVGMWLCSDLLLLTIIEVEEGGKVWSYCDLLLIVIEGWGGAKGVVLL